MVVHLLSIPKPSAGGPVDQENMKACTDMLGQKPGDEERETGKRVTWLNKGNNAQSSALDRV